MAIRYHKSIKATGGLRSIVHQSLWGVHGLFLPLGGKNKNNNPM